MFIISYLYDIIRNNIVSIETPIPSDTKIKREISVRICDMAILEASDIDNIKKLSHNSLLEVCILLTDVNKTIIKYALNHCETCREKYK